MKRIQDKIKDLVEPQSFEQVENFADDPAQALAAYRFTDMSSDLLSRWLDALAALPPGGGAAHALAGARGVGKSHTLAVFGALAGSERLRAGVEDSHVGMSARRLAGRRCLLVKVERGMRATLAEELSAAFAALFGGSEHQWGMDPAEMLTVAASRATGETLVVVIDTAFNRPARVARDDGPALGALAAASRGLNVFLALALDDDIAGADGANVVLAGTYQIDYLDPENLYRVADQFVLRKRPQTRDTLRDIYQALRAGVHDFNWSQSRFASIYPVHPLVAEVASGVRLYVPAFAFLPFAATAAARATSRSALALVLLDEVFDATEARLRESSELKGAFAAYDRLTERCIGQLPVMQRYQARLILKSLFILSLDGRGATPREMCAALLLTDESGADAPGHLCETLARFSESAEAGGLDASTEADGETRYRFHIAARETQQPAPRTAPSQKAATPVPARAEDESVAAEDESVAAEDGSASKADAPVARSKPAPRIVASDETSFSSLSDEVGFVAAISERIAAPVAPDINRTNEEIVGNEDGPLVGESVAWARLLTAALPLGPTGELPTRESVREALAAWLDGWRARGLRQKFESLPDGCLTTRVWKTEADVRKSFGGAASAIEAALEGKLSLEESLARVAEAFKRSPETFARLAQSLEDLTEFVEGFVARERERAYLAAAEPTGVDGIETLRRELLALAEDTNNFLDAARRERFDLLSGKFRTLYGEHYAAAHDKTVGAHEARSLLQTLKRGERWREFESLSRLPVVSSQVWRQAEELLRLADGGRCELPVSRMLEGQPSCACRFRLAQASELEALPQELETLMERGLAVYRRTLLMLGTNIAISLDALARRADSDEEARRARALSTAFAQGHAPEKFTRQDVRLIERALLRMPAPPPVKVVAPNGDTGLLTREELRARFVQWLDELPEQPVLIEIVSKAEINAP
ncbi:MAG TPA: hypothetical protein VEX60_01645 [Pyrinomonadaceae bacterium]|nr:hypothetical protein [Pyrinomonadaceae bacterium]